MVSKILMNIDFGVKRMVLERYKNNNTANLKK
jgi:hypothetical protein